METYEIKRILMPTDFSALANSALEAAIAMCKRQLATLTLIHVVENTFVLFPPEASSIAGTMLPQLVKDAGDNLGAMAREIRTNHDIVVDHVVQAGNPADEICRWALHKKIDLIVMGTHGASGLREFFLGSNTYRVVKNASCPVLSLPGYAQWLDFKKILFPIRLVPNALEKYKVIRPIIRKNNSSLQLAGIVKKDDSVGFVEMKTLVESVRKQIVEDHVNCGSEMHYTDNVARQVLQIASHEKPDLIVITATLDSPIQDFFLGPYTQQIVNHANFPVLSIKPEQKSESLLTVKSMMQEFPGTQPMLAGS